jgi:hypothetical protein
LVEICPPLTATLSKRLAGFPPPAEMSLTKLSQDGNNKFFPARKSLVNVVPAGDGKTANLFYSVHNSGSCNACTIMLSITLLCIPKQST